MESFEFPKKFPPNHKNQYEIQVTEFIRFEDKELTPTYILEVPANEVDWVPLAQNKGYQMVINSQEILQRRTRPGIETLIYPRFHQI